MPDNQLRLIALIKEEDDSLLAVVQEPEAVMLEVFKKEFFRNIRAYKMLIRNTPDHVREWLFTMNPNRPAEERFFPNGEKAWRYVIESGLRIRNI